MRLLVCVGEQFDTLLEQPNQLCESELSYRAGSERPVVGVEGRRTEIRRVREDECLKNRLLRGTRSPMRPSHTAWQLRSAWLISVGSSVKSKKQTYIVPLQYIKEMSSLDGSQ